MASQKLPQTTRERRLASPNHKRAIAAALVVLMLTSCGVSAELRDGPAPTPQAAPVPQVIVIQQPATARDDVALILLLLMACIVIGMAAAALGYIVGHHNGRGSLTTADALAVLQDAQLRVLTPAQYDALLRDAQRNAMQVHHERR